jgi:dipeptidyl-peptidase-4
MNTISMLQGKKLCLLTGLYFIVLAAQAQKKKFTMAEATNGMTTTLAVKNLKQPAWRPGTHDLFQVVKDGKEELVVRTSFPRGRTDTVESLGKLNKALYGKDSLKGLPPFGWLDGEYAYFFNGSSLDKGVLTGNGFSWSHWLTLPKEADNITVDKSRQLAYTVDNNLWMVTRDKRQVQVTNETDKNIISGQAVHRNEFGIEHGIFFSPKGNYLAYYHMDQTMVSDYPIVRWNEVPAKADITKYPMAGGTSHEVTVRVFDPATKQTIVLETGLPKDQYLTCVTWSPDEKYIYIAVLNRDQNHMWLNQYSAVTGKKLKTLFEETSKKYVEPQHPLAFLPGSNDQFIWWSQRDGFMHLYLYNTDGELVRRLTKGDYEVNELIGFNEKEHKLIITSAKESPLEKHSYTVDWTDGNMKRIDGEAGVHTVIASDDGAFICDAYTSATTPRNVIVRATEKAFEKTLLEAPDPLADYDRAIIRNITLTADDGTPLYGKMILPPDFDSNRKYPVIVYLYNGPHVQLVKNSYPASGNLWYEYMAQHGYIVFTMDGRGSSNRGRKFEQVIFRQLGKVEMRDQLVGIDYLKSRKYVDSKRMGMHGWSYGGFMTTSFMLKQPGLFKAAVAGGPVMDWSMYEIMYGERYMDTPEQNPEGYADANLITKAGNLKGKLLLIHGTDDNTVVWQHSINFLRSAVDKGIQVDYFVYPGYEHNVRGKDRVHLMQKVTDYFDLYLKP